MCCWMIGTLPAFAQVSSYFDFRQLDFSQVYIQSLAGQWCFNWQQFLPPSEPCSGESNPIQLPSKWNVQPNGQVQYPRNGYATYSTTLLLSKQSPQLGIYIPVFYRAGDFWVNGVKVAHVGVPGKHKVEEKPQDARTIVPLPEGAERIELVFHVSSFHHIDGGIHHTMHLAPLAELQRQERVRSFWSIFLVGSSVSFALYFLSMGVGPARRGDMIYLAGACLILTYTVRIIGIEQVGLLFDPNWSALWLLRCEYYGIVLSIPAYLYFLCFLFPQNVNLTVCRVALLGGVGSALTISLFPAEVFTWLRDTWIFMYLTSLLYITYCVASAMRQQRPDAWLNGSIVFLIIITTINDFFIWLQLFNGSNLVNLTYLFLVLGNASVLTLRMIRSAEKEVVLSNEIKQLNVGLQQKVEERTVELAEKVAELDMQKQRAESANLDKSRFLASASHDLRQPLHAINLFLDAIRNTDDKRERFALFDQMARSVSSLTELFDALLDISKLDAASIDIQLSALAIDDILLRLCDEFAQLASEKGLTLRYHTSDLVIVTDPLWFERIVRNLIANGLKYTQQGGLLVSARKRNNHVLMQVWDTGVGIEPAQQQIIFEEFVQVQQANKSPSGIGLGLAIVKRLADLMGHQVDLRSVPGRGSVFSLLLPLGDRTQIEIADNQTPSWLVSDDKHSHILLIEDNESIARAMQSMLQKWGYQVCWVANWQDIQCLYATDQAKPQAIISDYKLGGLDTGLTYLQRLQDEYQVLVPTLFVTGETNPQIIQQISQLGYRVLHKPVQPAKLRLMLKNLLV